MHISLQGWYWSAGLQHSALWLILVSQAIQGVIWKRVRIILYISYGMKGQTFRNLNYPRYKYISISMYLKIDQDYQAENLIYRYLYFNKSIKLSDLICHLKNKIKLKRFIDGPQRIRLYCIRYILIWKIFTTTLKYFPYFYFQSKPIFLPGILLLKVFLNSVPIIIALKACLMNVSIERNFCDFSSSYVS